MTNVTSQGSNREETEKWAASSLTGRTAGSWETSLCWSLQCYVVGPSGEDLGTWAWLLFMGQITLSHLHLCFCTCEFPLIFSWLSAVYCAHSTHPTPAHYVPCQLLSDLGGERNLLPGIQAVLIHCNNFLFNSEHGIGERKYIFNPTGALSHSWGLSHLVFRQLLWPTSEVGEPRPHFIGW